MLIALPLVAVALMVQLMTAYGLGDPAPGTIRVRGEYPGCTCPDFWVTEGAERIRASLPGQDREVGSKGHELWLTGASPFSIIDVAYAGESDFILEGRVVGVGYGGNEELQYDALRAPIFQVTGWEPVENSVLLTCSGRGMLAIALLVLWLPAAVLYMVRQWWKKRRSKR